MTRLVLPGSLARAVVAQPPAPRVPFRATVTSISGGLVTVLPVGSDTAAVLTLARLAGFALAINDEVMVEPAGTGWIVAGKVQRTAPTDYTLDAPLTAAIPQSIVVATASQNSADTSSTTDTVNYNDAMSVNVVLPAGTWQVSALVGLAMRHSAAGNVNLRGVIDGTTGSALTTDAASSGWTRLVRDQQLDGVAGGRTIVVKVQFKSSATGTTSADNPSAIVIAKRTT